MAVQVQNGKLNSVRHQANVQDMPDPVKDLQNTVFRRVKMSRVEGEKHEPGKMG